MLNKLSNKKMFSKIHPYYVGLKKKKTSNNNNKIMHSKYS